MEKLSINLTPDDLVVVDQLIRTFPLARRHMICRAALRAGLSQFSRDHTFALDRLSEDVQGAGHNAEGAHR